MKIICTQENLKKGLAMVGKIISPSNTLPILNYFLLKTENGMLKISSTNLEIGITTEIRCKAEEEGEAAIFAKTISELVNNLPNTNLTLTASKGEMKIENEDYKTVIKTLPSEDFPLIPQIEKTNTLTMEGQEMKSALDQVIFAASNNQTQPEIAGIMMQVKDEIIIAATDRYRLAEKKITIHEKTDTNLTVILPIKTAQELSRIIGLSQEKLQISIGQNQIGFLYGQTQLISRLVDGQYPEYEQIVPKDFNTQVKIKTKDLVSALRAGGIFSHGANSVVLECKKESQQVLLKSESSELGKSLVSIAAEIEGQDSQILLNYQYVLDCLNAVGSEYVRIKIIDDNSPAIIEPEGDRTYMYLVMPIKN